MERRYFIQTVLCGGVALFGAAACKKGPENKPRPALVHHLGDLRTLLLPYVHVRDRAMLVSRSPEGWSAMSSRCSYDGCDLSYDRYLFCPCCKSYFSLEGEPLGGLATTPLPRYKMGYQEVGFTLTADSGVEVPRATRFTTPELEELVAAHLKASKESEATMWDGAIEPEAALGKHAPPSRGLMFLEVDPNKAYRADMFRLEPTGKQTPTASPTPSSGGTKSK